jgi:hypothetical protein
MAKSKKIQKVEKEVKKERITRASDVDVTAAQKPVDPKTVLTEADKFFIKAKTEGGAPLDVIVAGVNKTTETVQTYLDSIKKTIKSPFENAIAKQTKAGKPVVSVMTEAASQISEDAVKYMDKPLQKYHDCITTIRDKE